MKGIVFLKEQIGKLQNMSKNREPRSRQGQVSGDDTYEVRANKVWFCSAFQKANSEEKAAMKDLFKDEFDRVRDCLLEYGEGLLTREAKLADKIAEFDRVRDGWLEYDERLRTREAELADKIDEFLKLKTRCGDDGFIKLGGVVDQKRMSFGSNGVLIEYRAFEITRY